MKINCSLLSAEVSSAPSLAHSQMLLSPVLQDWDSVLFAWVLFAVNKTIPCFCDCTPKGRRRQSCAQHLCAHQRTVLQPVCGHHLVPSFAVWWILRLPPAPFSLIIKIVMIMSPVAEINRSCGCPDGPACCGSFCAKTTVTAAWSHREMSVSHCAFC